MVDFDLSGIRHFLRRDGREPAGRRTPRRARSAINLPVKRMDLAGPVRIGIIGAGIAGERHAAAFTKHPDAIVAAVADIDPERGRRLASRFGAAYFADYRDALAHGLDAAIVCLPHALHLA